jgi:hypothetical protein
MRVLEYSQEPEDGGKILFFRKWFCCGHIWTKYIEQGAPLEEFAWTPVCPTCGGFDGVLFI